MNYTAACAAEGSFAVIRSIMRAHGRTSKDAGSLGGTSLLLAVKRQKIPCACEHLLINQNYTEFFFLGGGIRPVTAKPTPGKVKGHIFYMSFNMCGSHMCTHPPPRRTAIRAALLPPVSQTQYKQGFMYIEICRKLNIYLAFV